MANRIAILLVCAVALLVGPAATAQADSATQLPFANTSGAWLVVDPSAGHVFVSGGPGNSSIVVLNYAGGVVTTIPNEGGASGMALNPTTHTLYVALHDATAISERSTS
jgi:DNA-binding beta-propeller fold protein YncE